MVSIDPWYNNRWAQADANDIHMFRFTWWVPRALHMAAAKTLSFLRRLNVITPWRHSFAFNLTMWFIMRWWHDIETRHQHVRAIKC